jgi:multidrug efflux pump subunit AcrA (membrane-fusion protein)
MNEKRTRASGLVYALGALCAGAIVAAVLVVGPASGSTTTVTRTATVAQGVVQSTVSGSGNLQAASQLNLGFKTSGTVTNIYVSQGEHVTEGQLLATLDPQSAEVTLEQAKASLLSAEANLAKEEETDGEGTSAGGSSSAGGEDTANASAASSSAASIAYVANTGEAPTTSEATTTGTPTTTTGVAPTTTAPSTATPTTTTTGTSTATSPTPSTTTRTSTTTPSSTAPSSTAPSKTSTTQTSKTDEQTSAREGSTSSSSSATSTVSAATREANLASAKAAVKSDKLTVQSDEQAVQSTKLYAPESGTIVSLSGQVGETVSGGGTTKASTSSSSSESSSAGTTGAAATGARSSTSSGSSSSTGSTSGSSFAVLSDLSTMKLVVPLSESEIGNVKDGQIATVTVEALSGAKLAAHVSEVALTSTSNSGVVSYDVTFQLDQMETGLKTGMSATAEVIVKQAEGINVPTSAVSADSVTVERDGKQVRQRVVTGLAGNTSTIVLSGLKAGETVVLPAATTTSSSTGGIASKLGSRLGGAGAGGGLAGAAGGGGGFAGAGGGGGAFFRGGG